MASILQPHSEFSGYQARTGKVENTSSQFSVNPAIQNAAMTKQGYYLGHISFSYLKGEAVSVSDGPSGLKKELPLWSIGSSPIQQNFQE